MKLEGTIQNNKKNKKKEKTTNLLVNFVNVKKESNNNDDFNSVLKLNNQQGLQKELKSANNLIMGNNEINNKTKQEKYHKINKDNNNYNDFELNSFDYEKAVKFDKRTFVEYYFSLLKRKNIILFSFIPVKDYNSIIIKLCIFSLNFSIYYVMNYAYCNENIIHMIYKNKGKYNISSFMTSIIKAFIISYFINKIIKYIFLSERDILKVKDQSILSLANETSIKVKKNLFIKFVIFFIFGILLLVFFWFLLSSYGAVYQNTQIIIFKNTLISFSLGICFPFLINIFPVILRIGSLKSNSKYKKIEFNISKFLQIL